MLQELRENEKWELAPLNYPFGNGINFQLDITNVDKIYKALKSIKKHRAFTKVRCLKFSVYQLDFSNVTSQPLRYCINNA